MTSRLAVPVYVYSQQVVNDKNVGKSTAKMLKSQFTKTTEHRKYIDTKVNGTCPTKQMRIRSLCAFKSLKTNMD